MTFHRERSQWDCHVLPSNNHGNSAERNRPGGARNNDTQKDVPFLAGTEWSTQQLYPRPLYFRTTMKRRSFRISLLDYLEEGEVLDLTVTVRKDARNLDVES